MEFGYFLIGLNAFNLVNDQEQVAQFVRRGVAWRGGAGRRDAWR